MLVGKTLGKYRLTEHLGSGRLADVYRGTQIGLERAVVIKVLPASKSADPNLAQRFRQVSQATAKLTHPNILTIYDSGEQDGCLFFVMETLSTDTLEQRLKSQQVPDVEQSLKIALDVLKALEYCHAKGVTHGDLCPDRIRFDTRENAVLTGFGASPATDRGTDLARFGSLLFRLVTGRAPSATGHDQEVHPDLKALLRQCLEAKGAEQPPQTASYLQELRRIQRKQNHQRLSREYDAPGYRSPTGAYTGAYTGVSTMPSEFERSASRPRGFPRRAILSGLTGGYSDLGQRETRVRLAVVTGPFLILAFLGLLSMAAPSKLGLQEQDRRVGSTTCELRWKATEPCHSFVEYYLDPSQRHRAAPVSSSSSEFRLELSDLRPDTRYFFRFGFHHSPDVAPSFSSNYSFQTRPAIQVRDLQIVDRKFDRVTVRWSTFPETDTQVRLGESQILENPDQRQELDHSITLLGLTPNTEYRYQVVSRSPGSPDPARSSPGKRFRTRARFERQERPIIELAKRYIEKLGRMTPDEKERLERTIHEFLPGAEDLTTPKKGTLLKTSSTLDNFHERRLYLSLWVEQFELGGKAIPPGLKQKTMRLEADYIQRLFAVNSKRALVRLDQALQAMGRVEGLY